MSSLIIEGLTEPDVGEEFLNSDPIAWMLENFRIPETEDKRLILHPYQIACLKEALRKDEAGNYVYSTIVWCDIKKSIKSTIAAAVALWVAFNTEWGSVKITANDLKQADSRSAYYARRCIELNPVMKRMCKIKPSGYLIELPNHSRIEAIPIDPTGEAGGNDDAVFYSELWGAKSLAARKMWTETTLSPTKFGKSFRWIETYAGIWDESPILQGLWEAGVKQGARLDLSYDGNDLSNLNVYRNGRLFLLWNEEPRLSWQTPEYYAQEEATLEASEFKRVHRNQWGTSSEQFVPIEWWSACRANIPPLEARTSAVMALDAGISSDCFAMVVVSGSDTEGVFLTRMAIKWTPPKGGKIDFGEIDREVRRILQEYNIIEVAYDPYQLEKFASDLKTDLVANVYEFNQGAERAVADKSLHDSIRDKKILHDGMHPDLDEHIGNANREIQGDNKMRIIKRSQNAKIDLCVALSMARSRAASLNI